MIKKIILKFSRRENVTIAILMIFLLPFLFSGGVFAAAGVPAILHHQGRLLDASGNLLGGPTGTNYCFRFSFYDSASGGVKLWPTGSPSIMTVNVKNGVFNTDIGDTSAGGDALDFDFNSSDEIYLNVAVANASGGSCASVTSFETLSPRERIVSAGYAINSKTVGGFTPSQTPAGNQIPVLNSGALNLIGSLSALNFSGTSSGINTGDQTTISGNAGTATTLLTPRLINGVSFNGSANITIPSDIAPGTAGNILTSNGTIWTSAPSSVGANVALLNAANTFTNAGNTSFAGNVGIGTTSPTTSLQIGAGTLKGIAIGMDYPSWMGNNGLIMSGTLYAQNGFIVGIDDSFVRWGNSTTGISGNSVTGYLTFKTNSTEKMRIDTSGNVGIGTTAPASKLEVIGASSISVPISRVTPGTGLSTDSGVLSVNGRSGFGYDGTRGAVLMSDLGASKPIVFDSGAISHEVMRIQANGNVGIGTTNPASGKLQIAGGATTALRLDSNAGVAAINIGGNGELIMDAPGVGGGRFVVKDSGNVGIGVVSPTAALQLKAGTATAGTAPLKLTSGVNLTTTEAGAIEYDGAHLYFTAANAGTRFQLDQQTASGLANISDATITADSDANASGDIILKTGANDRLHILNNGNIGIGTAAPNYRLEIAGNVSSTGTIYAKSFGEATKGAANEWKQGVGSLFIDTAAYAAKPSFRFDQDVYAYADKNTILTVTAPALSAGEITSLFNTPQGQFIDLFGKTSPVVITVTGGSFGASSFDSTRGYVSLHSAAFSAISNLKIEVLKNSTWTAIYNKTPTSSDLTSNTILTGPDGIAAYMNGMRWTFTFDNTQHTYIHKIGALNPNETQYQWDLTRSGGTVYGNSNFLGNVGIGTVAPGQKLEVNGSILANGGSIYLNNTLARLSSNGTTGSYDFNYNTGATGAITFYGGGIINQFSVSNTGQGYFAGNVGIGTASPTTALQVNGGGSQYVNIGTNTDTVNGNYPGIWFTQATPTVTNYAFLYDSTQGTILNTPTGKSFLFRNNNANKMVIDSSGNVGIGTAAPSTKLDVRGNFQVRNEAGYQANVNAPVAYWGFSNTQDDAGRQKGWLWNIESNTNVGAGLGGRLTLSEYTGFDSTTPYAIPTANLNNLMTFYHSNVGIGTTTPTAVLQLKAGTATAGTAPLKLTSGVNLATTEAGAIEYDGTHLYFTAANAGTRYQLDQQSSGVTANLLFTPDNTYDIGASAANRPKNLFVAGTGTFGSTLSVTSGQAIGWNGRSFMNSNADGLIVIWNNAQNDFSRLQFGGTTNLFPSIKRNLTALNFRLADDSADASITALNGTFSGTVRQAGATNCGLSANASGDIICTSDINLKQNSRPFTSGLNAILALNPEYFQYKGESYTHAGFIAQNVQAVIPEATPLQGNGFLGLDTNAILAASVNAIKELDTKVTDLQANALGSASKPTGMTVYDKQGQVGCLEVDDVNTGTTSVRPGACITQTTTVVTPSPVPIPEPAPIGTPEPVPIPEPTPLTTPEPVPTPEPVTVPEPVPAPVLPPEQNAVTTPAPSLPETGSAPLRKNNLSGIIIFASIAALAAALSSTLYKIHAEKSHKQKEK